MRRKFPFISVGAIIDELRNEGIEINRVTFGRKIDKWAFPSGGKTDGGWRTYSRQEADMIKNIIKKNYRHIQSQPLTSIV